MAFRFDDRINQCFFLLFCHINLWNMWIDGLILHRVLSNFRASLLQGQIFLKALESRLIGLVLVKAHIFCQNDVLGDFGPYLIQIPIIEKPVLRKEDLIWQMHWLHIRSSFVERCGDVGIDGFIGRKVQSIVNLPLLYTIILPIVLLCYLLHLEHTDIAPFLHLLEKTVVKTRPALQCFDLVLSETMLSLRSRIDDDISAVFKYFFSNFIVSVVHLRPFLDDPRPRKGKGWYFLFDEVISRVVIVRPWVHLRKLERFRCRFSVYDSASSFHLSTDVLFVSPAKVVETVDHHEQCASFLHSRQFAEVEIVLTDYGASALLEKTVIFQRNAFPIDQFQSFSQLFLLLSAYQLLVFCSFCLHHCATGRSPSGLAFTDLERIVLVFLPFSLEASVLHKGAIFDPVLIFYLINSRSSQAVRCHSAY